MFLSTPPRITCRGSGVKFPHILKFGITWSGWSASGCDKFYPQLGESRPLWLFLNVSHLFPLSSETVLKIFCLSQSYERSFIICRLLTVYVVFLGAGWRMKRACRTVVTLYRWKRPVCRLKCIWNDNGCWRKGLWRCVPDGTGLVQLNGGLLWLWWWTYGLHKNADLSEQLKNQQLPNTQPVMRGVMPIFIVTEATAWFVRRVYCLVSCLQNIHQGNELSVKNVNIVTFPCSFVYQLTSRSRDLTKPVVAQLGNKFPPFMTIHSSLLCSQKPATDPCPLSFQAVL